MLTHQRSASHLTGGCRFSNGFHCDVCDLDFTSESTFEVHLTTLHERSLDLNAGADEPPQEAAPAESWFDTFRRVTTSAVQYMQDAYAPVQRDHEYLAAQQASRSSGNGISRFPQPLPPQSREELAREELARQDLVRLAFAIDELAREELARAQHAREARAHEERARASEALAAEGRETRARYARESQALDSKLREIREAQAAQNRETRARYARDRHSLATHNRTYVARSDGKGIWVEEVEAHLTIEEM